MEPDTNVPVEGGQDVQEINAPTDSGQGNEPFFVDHEGQTYASKDDLLKDWKASKMMRSDYTRKTQTLADERKKFLAEQEAHKKAIEEFQGKTKEFEKFDKFLRERPDVYRQLAQMMRQGPTPSGTLEAVEKLVEQKYGSKIEEFEKWKQQQDSERQKREAFAALKEQYPDFDENSVTEILGELGNGDLRTLAETLYFANKGKNSPLEAERKLTQKLKEKQSAGMVSSKGRESPNTNRKFSSIREAQEAALEEYTGG